MSEEKADYGTQTDEWVPVPKPPLGEMRHLPPRVILDEYGITEVFNKHLSLALETMHTAQAFEAAQHATRAYINSYNFIDTSSKGSDSGATSWRKVAKREFKEGPKA